MLAVQAEGASQDHRGRRRWRQLHPMQEAFRDNHGLQCGFCTPGMIMSALDLVKNNPDPSEREIREGSRATSAAAPAITTSSRRSRREPPVCAAKAARSQGGTTDYGDDLDRHAGTPARRTSASSPARAPTPTTSTGRASSTRIRAQRRTPTRRSAASTPQRPRRAGSATRCSPAPTSRRTKIGASPRLADQLARTARR